MIKTSTQAQTTKHTGQDSPGFPFTTTCESVRAFIPCPRLISPITDAGFLFHPARLRPSGKSNGREVTKLSIRQMVTVKAGGTDESPGYFKENGMTPGEENDIRIEMELRRIGDRRRGTDEADGYFKVEEDDT
jgi:hypothetical protein